MNPGMCEEVVTLRGQELVARGLHEQVVASVVPPRAGVLSVRTGLKQHLGKVLVRVRVRLLEANTGPRPWLAPGAVYGEGERASSHEPIYWLSPCRLP
jgi:hypothetical protein